MKMIRKQRLIDASSLGLVPMNVQNSVASFRKVHKGEGRPEGMTQVLVGQSAFPALQAGNRGSALEAGNWRSVTKRSETFTWMNSRFSGGCSGPAALFATGHFLW